MPLILLSSVVLQPTPAISLEWLNLAWSCINTLCYKILYPETKFCYNILAVAVVAKAKEDKDAAAGIFKATALKLMVSWPHQGILFKSWYFGSQGVCLGRQNW